MKTIFNVLFLLLPVIILAQNPVSNPGFENWTDGQPDSWITNNITPIVTTVTQSGTAHTGSYAAKGEIADFQGNPYYPSLSSGTIENPYPPVSQKYAKLSGYYQLQTTGSDFIIVSATLFDENLGVVATITSFLDEVTNQYKPFSLDFDYATGNNNDVTSMSINFLLSSRSADSIQVGAYFLIDDVELSGTTALETIEENLPQKYDLAQNFPNPFNPATTFRFSIPKKEEVKLSVYNLLGQQVALLVDKQLNAGTYSYKWDAEHLAGGTYFYRLKAGDFISTRKLVLSR